MPDPMAAPGSAPHSKCGPKCSSATSSNVATPAAVDPSKPPSPDGAELSLGHNRYTRRLLHFERKLQQQMECEDRRVKELTEAVLYELLPAALNAILPPCEDPATELHPDKCRAVVGCALAVSALMNAPPGFLEFLMCIPWSNLSQLYTKPLSMDTDSLGPIVADDERRLLVNAVIHPALMPTLLDFVLHDSRVSSVPPLLQFAIAKGGASAGASVTEHVNLHVPLLDATATEAVAALLDGAAPLHCAALRGNPALVDYLLYCGADPLVRTAAGEMPIELVPACGRRDPATGTKACRCMLSADQEVWECRSRIARQLLIRQSVLSMRMGVLAWVKVMLLCVLSWLGLWGCHLSLQRPPLAEHVERQREQRHSEAMLRAQKLLGLLRSEVARGQACMAVAQDGCGGQECQEEQALLLADLGDCPAERSFRSFVKAVHALQCLDLQSEVCGSGALLDCDLSASATVQAHVPAEEQAELFRCWAQSVLLKHRICRCPGCTALCVQAIRMAHIQATRLFSRLADRGPSSEGWAAVGRCLACVVHCHISLLLVTEGLQPATQASVWRAEQCLKEWESLVATGSVALAGLQESKEVRALQSWASTAHADLAVAEVLLGAPLGSNQSSTDVVAMAVTHNAAGSPYLSRPATPEVLRDLQAALAKSSSQPSPPLLGITLALLGNCAMELDAKDRLRHLLAIIEPPSSLAAVQALTDTIAAAAASPHLTAEVARARAVHDSWLRRAEAIERVEGAIRDVRAQLGWPEPPGMREMPLPSTSSTPIPPSGTTTPALGSVAADGLSSAQPLRNLEELGPETIEIWVRQLEAAIAEAKEVNIGVNRAKRLVKELQAVSAMVEAGRTLDVLLARKPCGSAALKTGLSKAETAASGAGSLGCNSTLCEPLLARIQVAKRRFETERAAEALHKAVVQCRVLADLPRLEAAILSARKVSAEELDPESYAAASDARARLADAAKARSALEAAVRNLQRQPRSEEIAAVERCLAEAAKWQDLLSADSQKARSALDAVQSATASEAKLNRVLREGAGITQLGRAIQEAAAAGVKVQAAKRTLKAMQALEVAMHTAIEQPSQHAQLRTRIDAARASAVSPTMLREARRLLRRCLLAGAQEVLESALKPHSDWNVSQRAAVLKAALDKAEQVLGRFWDRPVACTVAGDADAALLVPGSPMTASRTGSTTGGESSALDAGAVAASAATTEQDTASESVRGDAASSEAGGEAPSELGTEGGFQNEEVTSAEAEVEVEEDDEALSVVRALALRVWQLLQADQRQMQQLEAEKQAAERSRRLAQEQERQQRERTDQEKAERDKAERSRIAAERKERERVERASKPAARPKEPPLQAAAAAAAAAAPPEQYKDTASRDGRRAPAAAGGRDKGRGGAQLKPTAVATATTVPALSPVPQPQKDSYKNRTTGKADKPELSTAVSAAAAGTTQAVPPGTPGSAGASRQASSELRLTLGGGLAGAVTLSQQGSVTDPSALDDEDGSMELDESVLRCLDLGDDDCVSGSIASQTPHAVPPSPTGEAGPHLSLSRMASVSVQSSYASVDEYGLVAADAESQTSTPARAPSDAPFSYYSAGLRSDSHSTPSVPEALWQLPGDFIANINWSTDPSSALPTSRTLSAKDAMPAGSTLSESRLQDTLANNLGPASDRLLAPPGPGQPLQPPSLRMGSGLHGGLSSGGSGTLTSNMSLLGWLQPQPTTSSPRDSTSGGGGYQPPGAQVGSNRWPPSPLNLSLVRQSPEATLSGPFSQPVSPQAPMLLRRSTTVQEPLLQPRAQQLPSTILQWYQQGGLQAAKDGAAAALLASNSGPGPAARWTDMPGAADMAAADHAGLTAGASGGSGRWDGSGMDFGVSAAQGAMMRTASGTIGGRGGGGGVAAGSQVPHRTTVSIQQAFPPVGSTPTVARVQPGPNGPTLYWSDAAALAAAMQLQQQQQAQQARQDLLLQNVSNLPYSQQQQQQQPGSFTLHQQQQQQQMLMDLGAGHMGAGRHNLTLGSFTAGSPSPLDVPSAGAPGGLFPRLGVRDGGQPRLARRSWDSASGIPLGTAPGPQGQMPGFSNPGLRSMSLVGGGPPPGQQGQGVGGGGAAPGMGGMSMSGMGPGGNLGAGLGHLTGQMPSDAELLTPIGQQQQWR